MPRRRSWTDDELIAALDGATTMKQVVERLRLRAGGASYTTVRIRMEQLGLEPPSRPSQPSLPSLSGGPATLTTSWRRTFTAEQLEAAVAAATSLRGVFVELGLDVGGSQWVTIRRLIQERGLSTAHWRRPLGQPNGLGVLTRFRAALERTDLESIVAAARSRADVIRTLEFEPASRLYRELALVLEERGIDIEHFEPPHARMQLAPPRPRRPLETILVRGSSVTDTNRLRLRLIDEGVLETRCASCGLDEWLGRPIPLQLDHIDGDRTNNLLENLRLLCPTCHALTDTYCGRNIGRVQRGHDGDDAE